MGCASFRRSRLCRCVVGPTANPGTRPFAPCPSAREWHESPRVRWMLPFKARMDSMAATRTYPAELQEQEQRLAVEARQDPERQRGALRRVAEQLRVNPAAGSTTHPLAWRDRARPTGRVRAGLRSTPHRLGARRDGTTQPLTNRLFGVERSHHLRSNGRQIRRLKARRGARPDRCEACEASLRSCERGSSPSIVGARSPMQLGGVHGYTPTPSRCDSLWDKAR